MRKKYFPRFIILLFIPGLLSAQSLLVKKTNDTYQISVLQGGKALVNSPEEGLWSIATDWENGWPSNWHHAKVSGVKQIGEWTEVVGGIKLPQGEWLLKDYYREESGKIKCIRRFEWKGKETLNKVTLSIRWILPSTNAKPFLPGIIYYGNPSGEMNGKNNVAWYHGEAGEEALFEEHRYPMPFASMEWKENNLFYGAAIHTIPSPVYRGNHHDQ